MTDLAQKSPELLAVLGNQEASAAKQAVLNQLHQAIAVQNANAAQLRVHAEHVAELETQREDLLADIATGQDKAAELKALDTRLAQQKKDMAVQGSQAAIDQTVAGLMRKLERVQGELQELQGQRPALLRRLLCTQAEALGAEYVTTAFELKALHRRLMGLSSMLDDLGLVPSVLAGMGAILEIPAPNLGSVKPHADYINANMLIAREYDRRNFMNWVEKEKAALRNLGVEIS